MADFWSDLTGGALHTGSWFGLPDFGVTEAFAQDNLTDDGGSNLLGTQQATAPIISGDTTGGTLPPVGGAYPQPAPTGSIPTQTTQQPSGPVSFDSIYNSMYPGWDRTAAEADWRAKGMPSGSGTSSGPSAEQIEADRIRQQQEALRGEISGGYDQYIGKLNQMMEQGLPGQASNMNQIVGNQFASGQESLTNQQNLGLSDLGSERTQATQNQSKNLKDISENLRNMFMSGNVFLGSRGAGDSSAANQYSYALTKVGNKARGDVMSQTAGIQAEIGKRETNLKQTVQSELQNLGRERDNKVLEVSSWLAEQQNSIRDRIGQVGLSKSTDLANLNKTLLDNALAKLQQAEQDVKSRASMLEQWAMNQSTNINQLKSNMAQVSSYNPQLPQAQQFSGTPTVSGGNIRTPINWSQPQQREEEEKPSNVSSIFDQYRNNPWNKVS